MQIDENISYRDVNGHDSTLNSLDVYYEPLQNGQPKKTVVVFLHGGSWTGGDKSCFVGIKKRGMPGWFVEQDCVFVALNFRLASSPQSPDARISDMADDVAKALKWLTVNGRRYGGRKTGFVLLGHSSGAHLAALVAADESYLRRFRLKSSDVRAVIAMDVPHFDVPLALEILEKEDVGLGHQGRRLDKMHELLGKTRATQARFSPAAHLGPWLRETSFLLLSAGLQRGQAQSFSRRMSEHFCYKLVERGIEAEHHHFDKHKHTDFIRRFRGEISDHLAGYLARLGLVPGASQPRTLEAETRADD